VLLPGLKEGEFLLDGRPAAQLLFVIRAQAGERPGSQPSQRSVRLRVH
jgi:hypothetical protein